MLQPRHSGLPYNPGAHGTCSCLPHVNTLVYTLLATAKGEEERALGYYLS